MSKAFQLEDWQVAVELAPDFPGAGLLRTCSPASVLRTMPLSQADESELFE